MTDERHERERLLLRNFLMGVLLDPFQECHCGEDPFTDGALCTICEAMLNVKILKGSNDDRQSQKENPADWYNWMTGCTCPPPGTSKTEDARRAAMREYERQKKST